MPTTVTIGGTEFPSKKAAISHYRAILHRDILETEIVGKDAVFVEALLYARPEKVAELGSHRVVPTCGRCIGTTHQLCSRN